MWLSAVIIHSFPRKYFEDLYYQHFRDFSLSYNVDTLIKANWYCALVELISLNGLSFFTSVSNFELHKFFFGLFLVFSFGHMILTVYIQRPIWYRSKTSVYSKRVFLALSVLLIPALLLLYNRHTYYCYPYNYTYFCFCEYFVVLLNILFNIQGLTEFSIICPTKRNIKSLI